MREIWWVVILVLLGGGYLYLKVEDKNKQTEALRAELKRMQGNLDSNAEQIKTTGNELAQMKLDQQCNDLDKTIRELKADLSRNVNRDAELNRIRASKMNPQLTEEARRTEEKIKQNRSDILLKQEEVRKLSCGNQTQGSQTRLVE